MKIRQLDIEGFRSLKRVSWTPGDLNVVIGPNGTGKSNLLRMLELISASAQGGLGNYIQRVGGIEALLWDGRSENIVTHFWTLPELPEDDPFSLPALGYELNLSRMMGIRQESLEAHHITTGEATLPHSRLLVRHVRVGSFLDRQGHTQDVPKEAIMFDESLLSIVGRSITPAHEIYEFQSYLDSWTIYHDIRTDRDAPVRQAPVSRLEKIVSSDGQNLINVLHTLYTGEREFKQAVNAAMQAAFGDDFDELIFPPAADQRIQLRVRWKTLKREQSAADLSDGTLRFLFLLAVLANPSPSPLIAIDEPETGLHPSMLPIVAEYAVEASQRTQVIFTTHSDQFLDAFTDTKPTTTVAKWADGETTLTVLDGAALDYWLKEYSLGKLFRSGELEAMA